jgi:transcriptional regulator with XRE-family HTH domain
MNDDLSEPETDAPSAESSSETTTGLPSLEDTLAERAEKLGEFIRDQRRIARLSLRKLSDMAQISNPYLSQIERGLRKPSAEILQQLAKALRISAETLYVQAGILEERKDEPDLVSAIRREPTLTEAQKRALVQVLRSFQAENRVGGFGEQSS